MNLSNLKVPPPVIDYAKAEKQRDRRACRKALLANFFICILAALAVAGATYIIYIINKGPFKNI